MNLLQSLPLSLGKCPMIETFDFAENTMSCLPNAIFSKDIVGMKAFLHSLNLQFSKCIVSFQDFGLNVFLLMPNLSWELVRELDLGKKLFGQYLRKCFQSFAAFANFGPQ